MSTMNVTATRQGFREGGPEVAAACATDNFSATGLQLERYFVSSRVLDGKQKQVQSMEVRKLQGLQGLQGLRGLQIV